MNLDNKEKFLSLVSEIPSGWKDKAEWRAKNQAWLRNSALIATRILRAIREKKITQIELSKSMGVSPQYLGKILRGQENLTLETIDKLETALAIKLLHFESESFKVTSVETYQLPSGTMAPSPSATSKTAVSGVSESGNYTNFVVTYGEAA